MHILHILDCSRDGLLDDRLGDDGRLSDPRKLDCQHLAGMEENMRLMLQYPTAIARVVVRFWVEGGCREGNAKSRHGLLRVCVCSQGTGAELRVA